MTVGSEARSLRHSTEWQGRLMSAAFGFGDNSLCLDQCRSGWSSMQRGTYSKHHDGFIEFLSQKVKRQGKYIISEFKNNDHGARTRWLTFPGN